jgi:L-aminopeptidase/D-esterase-like protein
VTRRTSLPGAAELFRSTSAPLGGSADDDWLTESRTPVSHRARQPSSRSGSPRQKHASKITVYVSDEELLALEHSRLALRATHGLAVDRGRVVREAIAIMLADLEENGEESMLVRRLRPDAS